MISTWCDVLQGASTADLAALGLVDAPQILLGENNDHAIRHFLSLGGDGRLIFAPLRPSSYDL
jgi:hypothetical protein